MLTNPFAPSLLACTGRRTSARQLDVFDDEAFGQIPIVHGAVGIEQAMELQHRIRCCRRSPWRSRRVAGHATQPVLVD